MRRLEPPPGYRTQSEDTDYTTELLLLERWRALLPWEKARIIDQLARADDHLARVGTRHRWPAATEDEIRLRTAAIRLGASVVREHLGWDPEVEGW
jgi:hypothetical protein